MIWVIFSEGFKRLHRGVFKTLSNIDKIFFSKIVLILIQIRPYHTVFLKLVSRKTKLKGFCNLYEGITSQTRAKAPQLFGVL